MSNRDGQLAREIQALMANGMSQADVAYELGISRQLVWHHLKGKDRRPRRRDLSPERLDRERERGRIREQLRRVMR